MCAYHLIPEEGHFLVPGIFSEPSYNPPSRRSRIFQFPENFNPESINHLRIYFANRKKMCAYVVKIEPNRTFIGRYDRPGHAGVVYAAVLNVSVRGEISWTFIP